MPADAEEVEVDKAAEPAEAEKAKVDNTAAEPVDAEEVVKEDNLENQGGGESSTSTQEQWKKTKKELWEAMKKRREELPRPFPYRLRDLGQRFQYFMVEDSGNSGRFRKF